VALVMSLKKKMISFPNTLAFRLTFWYALVFISLITTAIIVTYFSLNELLNQNMKKDLIEDITEFKILYQNEGLDRVKQEIKREVKSDDEENVFIRLINKNGNQIYSSDLSHWQSLPKNQHIVQQVFSSKKFVFQTVITNDKKYDTKTIYDLIAPDILIHIGESTEEIQNIMTLLYNIFITILLIVIPVASTVSWLIAKQAVKGINEVSRIAKKIEKGQLDRRVFVSAQGYEIEQLVNTFNAMLDRIWILISEMKEMTDNIAHDLRSPLARIRVISELVLSNENTPHEYKSSASDTIEECDRLLQMVNSTLDVAEAEAGASQLPKQNINISQLAQDACELFEATAEQKHIKLLCQLKSDCYIFGQVQYLQRMLANLLDNAIKYTLDNGRVDIVLTCTKEDIEITISDTGIGIPDKEQSRVFDRFYRCDQSRTHDGCGLGLSFSRAVARSHGGDINLRTTEEKGCCFTIKLPIK